MKNFQISEFLQEAMVDFCSGKLNREQANELLQWIEKSDDHRKVFNEFCETWRMSGFLNDDDFDSEKAFRTVKLSINERGLRPLRSKYLKIRTNFFFKIAATLLFLVISGSIYNIIKGFISNTESAISYYEAVAPKGSRAFIKMPDGSSIWLNADTRLKYTNKFGETDREIILEGEAYFDVEISDKGLPFKVITSDISITALGTAFNVKSYNDESVIETTLEEGSLQIEAIGRALDTRDNQPVVLTPNQSAVFSKGKDIVSVSNSRPEDFSEAKDVETYINEELNPLKNIEPLKVSEVADTKVYTSWKDSRWIIKNEELSLLIPKLERRYDVTITLMDISTGNFAITATLMDESLEQVLEAIRLIAPIKYEVRSKDVYVYTDDVLKKQYSKALTQP